MRFAGRYARWIGGRRRERGWQRWAVVPFVAVKPLCPTSSSVVTRSRAFLTKGCPFLLAPFERGRVEIRTSSLRRTPLLSEDDSTARGGDASRVKCVPPIVRIPARTIVARCDPSCVEPRILVWVAIPLAVAHKIAESRRGEVDARYAGRRRRRRIRVDGLWRGREGVGNVGIRVVGCG